MKLRAGGIILALGILAAPPVADAQAPAKPSRIGVLFSGLTPAVLHLHEAFRRGPRELGYVEGQNVAVEFRSAEGTLEPLPGLAAELVRPKADVIVAASTPAAQAAQQATKTIPIVMVSPADPVSAGLIASLARPGGNLTGLT